MKSTDEFSLLWECAVGMGAAGAADIFLQRVGVFETRLSFRGDRDSQFNASKLTDVLVCVGCQVHLALEEKSVGLAERFIRHVKEILRPLH